MLKFRSQAPVWSARILLTVFVVASSTVGAQTNRVTTTNRLEQVRADCINGRRYICGQVVQVTADGLVVDSGYTSLLQPPFHTSWVVSGTVSATRDPNAVEAKAPDSACIGLVFVRDIPKQPKAKLYDYVVIHGYPAGGYVYKPVAPVQKKIRKFSASLDSAVKLMLSSNEERLTASDPHPPAIR